MRKPRPRRQKAKEGTGVRGRGLVLLSPIPRPLSPLSPFTFLLLPSSRSRYCYNPPHSPLTPARRFSRTARALRVIKRGTMNDLRARPGNHRPTFVLALCAALALASALPLTVASCRTQRPRADEAAAFERLRALTRGGTLPPEPVVEQLGGSYSGTRTGALAGLLRARIRYEAHNYVGARSEERRGGKEGRPRR